MHNAIRHIESGQPQLLAQPILVSKRQAATLKACACAASLITMKPLPCRRIGWRVLIPHAVLVAFARRDHLSTARTGAEQRA
jgi:hypothetical protein